MDLWIRSQDSERLIKVNYVEYFYQKIQYNQEERPREENFKIGTYMNTFGPTFIILGEYKTEERALEVLDEIQSLLKPALIFNNIDISQLSREDLNMPENSIVLGTSRDKGSIEYSGTYVYEMPQE